MLKPVEKDVVGLPVVDAASPEDVRPKVVLESVAAGDALAVVEVATALLEPATAEEDGVTDAAVYAGCREEDTALLEKPPFADDVETP